MKQIKRAKKILGYKALRGLFLISFAALSMGGYFKAQAQGAIPMSQAAPSDFQQGGAIQLFHEVKKPGGETAGWLIGVNHAACVERDSFPQEVNQAMDRADIGLIELKISETARAASIPLYLPEGTSLPDLIGEQKTQELFDFIHHNFKEEYIRKAVELKIAEFSISKSFNPDMTLFNFADYSAFIHLSPEAILTVVLLINVYQQSRISLTHEDEAKDSLKRFYSYIEEFNNKQRSLREILSRDLVSGNNQERNLFKFMIDCYYNPKIKEHHIEERFVCSGRPVHSMESVESQATDIKSGFSLLDQAKILVFYFDKLQSEEVSAQEQSAKQEFGQIINALSNNIMMSASFQYLYGMNMENTLDREFSMLSDFLSENQCLDSSESDVRALVNKIFEFHQFNIEFAINGLEMDQTTEAYYRRQLREQLQLQNNIFTSCFPDYSLTEDSEEQQRREIETRIEMTKKSQHGLLSVRDFKMAQTIISHLEDGKVFAAMGAGHLNGVIRHLETEGLVVEPVRLSQPWNILGSSMNKICHIAKEGNNFIDFFEGDYPPL